MTYHNLCKYKDNDIGRFAARDSIEELKGTNKIQ